MSQISENMFDGYIRLVGKDIDGIDWTDTNSHYSD